MYEWGAAPLTVTCCAHSKICPLCLAECCRMLIFFFFQNLALVQILSLHSGRERWLIGLKVKNLDSFKSAEIWPWAFQKKWPNQSSYYSILWPVTNTWIDICLQEMLARVGGSHWLVLFTAPQGSWSAAKMERLLHRCTVYSPKWVVNQSRGRKGWKNGCL